MPLYEYRCHGCGKHFEVLQKFSDEPLTHHEECGGEVERLISPPALQFKGSGWYVTDYGGKSNGDSQNKSDTKPAAKSDSSGETKTSTSAESTPAPTSSKE